MPDADAILDHVQERLHDAGTLWTRAELLRWLNDGYRELLAKSRAVRRIHLIDVPPRYAYTFTYEWEDRHTQQAPSRMMFWPALDATRRVTSLWEAEHLEGVTPTQSYAGKTQEWERAYGEETDRHLVFALPRQHDVIKRVAWDDKKLNPTTVREFDETDDAWMRRPGEPWWWTPGLGRIASIEIYEIVTDYTQSYLLENPVETGFGRYFSGTRTYSAEADPLDNGFAYTTTGDAEAITWQSTTFLPISAYTDTGDIGAYYAAAADLPTDHLPTYQWTLTSSRHDRKCTQEWEAGDGTETGAQRGQMPWAAMHGSTVPPASQQRVGAGILTGLGWRFTQEAVGGFHGTQVWEKEMEEGKTTFSAGATVGTYAWEAMHGASSVTFAVGTVRALVSPDRQYWALGHGPSTNNLLGAIRDLRSSTDAVEVTHSVVPDLDLTEADEPDLIPSQLAKYLRYYVLARAFGRSGPGQRGDLAQHYEDRFAMGVLFFKRLGDIAHADHMYVRESAEEAGGGRPPYVRLPSEYEQVW